MAISRSTELINKLAQGYGIREVLADGRIQIYSGVQPANADTAATGSHLLTFSLGGIAYVDGTKSLATIAIGGTAAGTLDTIKVGGMDFNLLSEAVSFNSGTQQTASDIVDNINARMNPLNIIAVANVSDVELHAPIWLGSDADGLSFLTSVTGNITATTSGVFGSGVFIQNGINFVEKAVDGVLNKAAEVWQGSGIIDGTAGYFRFIAGGSTSDGVSGDDIRFDGNIGTSNSDMIISSTTIVPEAIYSITSGSIAEVEE